MKKQTLKEQAYIKIKTWIIQGKFKPGTSLTERELTHLLGMSRTPIRSALDKLEADGFIINTPNKGPIVSNISIKKLVDIYDLRIALESYVVTQYNTLHISSNFIQSIKDNLQMQNEALMNENELEFSKLDTSFHLMILNYYGNEEIARVFMQIQDQLTMLALEVFKKNPGNLKIFYDDHQKIVEHLIVNQGTDAAQVITNHLEFGKKSLIMS